MTSLRTALAGVWLSAAWACAQPASQPIAPDQLAKSLITLHVADAHPSKVCESLAEQSGATICPWPAQIWTEQGGQAPPRITLDLEAATFWSAMARFCAAANVRPQFVGGQPGICLVPGSAGGMLGGRLDDRGAFAIVASQIARNRAASFADDSMSRDDRIELLVYIDPAVNVLRFARPMALETAVGNGGIKLLPRQPGGGEMVGLDWHGPRWMVATHARLDLPPDAGRKIARLKGSLRVQVVGRAAPLEIDDLENAARREVSAGNRTVKVTRFQIVDEHSAMLDLELTRPREAELLGPSLLAELRAVQIIDGEGTRVTSEISGGGGNALRAHWHGRFADARLRLKSGKPIKLVWNVPVEAQTVDVPFEFRDLPLPHDAEEP
jgi:hypothetical protein